MSASLHSKHFQAFAARISKIENGKVRMETALVVAKVCKRFNENFNHDRFLRACLVTTNRGKKYVC